MEKHSIFFICAFIVAGGLFAQQTTVKGNVTEKGRNEPMPFVSVAFKGTTVGMTTDFEGNYSIRTALPVDTLVVSFLGYKTVLLPIKRGQAQIINIEMEEHSQLMREAVVKAGINPAIRIIDKAVAMRKHNNFANLSSYEFTSYNKVDVSMNNISEKMKKNKLLQPLGKLFDTAYQMKNEDGKYILPVFISETESKYYYQANPIKSKEIITANQIMGFGVNQGSYVIDMLGTSLLQFNFNDNWMRVLVKDFVSPISSNCHNFYWYTLRDSVDIDGLKCYEIKIQTKRESDLGFIGTIWIADSTYALRRIVADISPNANLNFIERLKIQQEQLPTSAGPWLPVKTRIIVELSRITENTSGFVSKMYRSNSQVVVNQPKPESFFDVNVDRQEGHLDRDTSYWQKTRPEKFTATETQMRNMIDSVKGLPVVKTYTDVIRLLSEGYYRVGKIDWGPYVFLANYNQVEGFRTRFGLKTNQNFSRNWFYLGYAAYGFGDEKFKYGGSVERIINHRKWTTASFAYKNDYDILGVNDPSSTPIFNFGSGASNVFAALNFGSNLTRINQTIDYRAIYLKQLSRDWTIRLIGQSTYFKPLGKFDFGYKINDKDGDNPANIRNDYTYAAATIDIRYAYKEVLIAKGNSRLRLKLAKAPVTTFSYQRGIKGIAGGNFNYDKIRINLNQHITTGFLGNADYSLTAGKVFGKLPYPLLEVMRGNNTFVQSDNNFSLMNLYEFVADEYVYFWYVQHFEGMFFNRVPVFKKWKLRNYAVTKAAFGSISPQNKNFHPESLVNINSLSFNNEPYVEVGYGIENIFRIMSIGMVHRLTHLNHSPDVRPWGVNVGFLFQF